MKGGRKGGEEEDQEKNYNSILSRMNRPVYLTMKGGILKKTWREEGGRTWN